MYAVIEMGGKQYRVIPEQILYVEKTGFEKGNEIDIKNVLLFENDNKVSVGKPILANVAIKAMIIDDVKAPKISGFKYKSKKNYRRRWGHRQSLQKIQITSMKG
ncbi:MAG: 50S ribosomal protein L21 [Spirochaetia bacterium]|nr:50S ribosomal protein L21 [Spirochaetia bacterium]